MSAATVMMRATDAAAWMTGAHLAGPDAAILRVTTDSRAVQPGDLFVALIGERFDAHDFLPDVIARVGHRQHGDVAHIQRARQRARHQHRGGA
ncbi:MAG: Mur ligase domain-containing protein, partial [Pseudomonadota bacterium]